MSYRATISGSGHRFTIEQGETVLQAALHAGLALNFGCANGTCGDCKARIVDGDVATVRFHDYVITAAEKQMGYALLCCTGASSDITIEAVEARTTHDIAPQCIETRVHKITAASEDVLLVTLRTPRSHLLRFLSGQSVTLTMDELVATTKPIASCACDGMNLQFHVRRGEDAFAERVFAELKRSDRVLVKGPVGHFVLDEGSSNPILFVAYDTGFAPINSLIEHAINVELSQPMRLYWCAPGRGPPYLHNCCRAWADVLDNFHYVPLSAVCGPADGAEAETAGRRASEIAVESIAQSCRDLPGHDCYLSGPPWFVSPVQHALSRLGLPHERLFVNDR